VALVRKTTLGFFELFGPCKAFRVVFSAPLLGFTAGAYVGSLDIVLVRGLFVQVSLVKNFIHVLEILLLIILFEFNPGSSAERENSAFQPNR